MPTAVERVITTMWQQYDQPLSLAEMADEAIFSRFYFSRVFRAATGTSPGRYLTAVRLSKAKQFLLQTPASVTDISYRVGYNSPGTFSTRFTLNVGLSPARYRKQAEAGLISPGLLTQRSGWAGGRVTCRLAMPNCGMPTRTYLSLAGRPGQPGFVVACELSAESRNVELENLPEGPLTIRAVAVPTGGLDPRPWARRPLLLSDPVELTVSASRVASARMQLRPPRFTDLPVLIALPELDNLRSDDLPLDDLRSLDSGLDDAEAGGIRRDGSRDALRRDDPRAGLRRHDSRTGGLRHDAAGSVGLRHHDSRTGGIRHDGGCAVEHRSNGTQPGAARRPGPDPRALATGC